MNRREKIDSLLYIAPTVGADIDLPVDPPRFVALEQDDSGNTLWVYFTDKLYKLNKILAGSETQFVSRIRVHDLDTDAVLEPIWKIARFAEIEDEFSYANGYETIP